MPKQIYSLLLWMSIFHRKCKKNPLTRSFHFTIKVIQWQWLWKYFLFFCGRKKNIITSTQLNFPVCWRWANVSNRIFIKFQNRCIFIMIIRWWLNQECWCRRSLEEGNWMMMWIRRVFDAETDKSEKWRWRWMMLMSMDSNDEEKYWRRL